MRNNEAIVHPRFTRKRAAMRYSLVITHVRILIILVWPVDIRTYLPRVFDVVINDAMYFYVSGAMESRGAGFYYELRLRN